MDDASLEGVFVLVILLGVWLVIGAAAADIAKKKGYSQGGFLVVGLVLGLLGVALALILPSRPSHITPGSVAIFSEKYRLKSGNVCTRGMATKVHEVDVKAGKPAALIDAPNGTRCWVPLSVLHPA